MNPGRSQEHAWPVWFVEAWAELARQYGTDPAEDYVLTSDEGILRTFKGALTVGGICRSCNNGWMGTLEGRAKPIILDVMVGNARDLSEREQRTLSRWAVMKSLVFVLATPNTSVVASRYRQLYRGEIGPASIRLMSCDEVIAGGLFTVRALTSHPASFHSVFRMGRVVLHVLGHIPSGVPDNRLMQAETDRRALRIWPPTVLGRFPPELSVTADDVDRLMHYQSADPG